MTPESILGRVLNNLFHQRKIFFQTTVLTKLHGEDTAKAILLNMNYGLTFRRNFYMMKLFEYLYRVEIFSPFLST
jgi:hypothetical protein